MVCSMASRCYLPNAAGTGSGRPTLPSPSPSLEQELNTVIVIRIRERGQWEQDREGRRDVTEAMATGGISIVLLIA